MKPLVKVFKVSEISEELLLLRKHFLSVKTHWDGLAEDRQDYHGMGKHPQASQRGEQQVNLQEGTKNPI